ncbi:MAG: hypothetical protein U5R06_13625 [candidate division KSB1 bacterium]|nr:hypothetical protein [candidate division KSB1 bacterium]
MKTKHKRKPLKTVLTREFVILAVIVFIFARVLVQTPVGGGLTVITFILFVLFCRSFYFYGQPGVRQAMAEIAGPH